MYAAIHHIQVADPIRRDEVAERLSEGILPALRQTGGVVATCLVALEDGSVACLSVHRDWASAEATIAQSVAWIELHLATLVVVPTHVETGRVWGDPHALAEGAL